MVSARLSYARDTMDIWRATNFRINCNVSFYFFFFSFRVDDENREKSKNRKNEFIDSMRTLTAAVLLGCSLASVCTVFVVAFLCNRESDEQFSI